MILNPEQTKILSVVAGRGNPVVIGMYVAGMVRSGKKVNEKTGATEQYAGIQHAVLCGRKVLNVKTYVDRDPALFASALAAEGNDVLTDKLLPAKNGEAVVVEISSYKIEKGTPVVTGIVTKL